MNGLMGSWLVPVNPRAKRPRVFKVPFRADWDVSSRWLLHRMGNLGSRWGPRLQSHFEQTARRHVVPMARRALSARYHWTGRAAQAIRVTGSGSRGYSAPGQRTTHGPWVEVGLDPDVIAEEPLFGDWAGNPFSVPTALHEGIKRHVVYIWRPGWPHPRRNLERWARAHGLRPPERYPAVPWSITVYSRGRARSRNPFLWASGLAQRDRFIEAPAITLDLCLRQTGAPLIFNPRSAFRY